MEYKPFHFKQFDIVQDVCTHKVGTDGVLLGAWVNLNQTERAILDVGTGSGLIAIMMAQRTSQQTSIDAIDIELKDVQQAKQNVQRSRWPERITIVHTSLQKFLPAKQYDLVVSNPPYFESSLLPHDESRKRARHTMALPFHDLLGNAARLLSQPGRLAVILPCREGRLFVHEAQNYHLFPHRTATFRSRASKPPERLLVELSQQKQKTVEEKIVLYADANEWSQQYKQLTRDFYLKA